MRIIGTNRESAGPDRFVLPTILRPSAAESCIEKSDRPFIEDFLLFIEYQATSLQMPDLFCKFK
jgi:hypothetical protein